MGDLDDRMGVEETASAEVTRQYVPPRFPCTLCGKETLEHTPEVDVTDGGVVDEIPRRICTSQTCRHVSRHDRRK